MDVAVHKARAHAQHRPVDYRAETVPIVPIGYFVRRADIGDPILVNDDACLAQYGIVRIDGEHEVQVFDQCPQRFLPG